MDKKNTFLQQFGFTMHRGVICQLLFWWIYYCHSSKSTTKKTGKTHLCAMRRNSNLSHVLSLKIEKTPSKVGEFARTVKTLYIFFNVFYALSTNLRVFPISVQWIIMFHLVWKRDPYILDTTWDFGHSDIARSAKWRMKFQMEGTRHSPFNNDKWFANGKKMNRFAST